MRWLKLVYLLLGSGLLALVLVTTDLEAVLQQVTRIGWAGGEQDGDEGRHEEEEQPVEEHQGRRSREPPASCRLRVNTYPP